MNFVDKFGGSLPSADAYARGSVHVDSISTHAPAGAIVVEDGKFLFTADFKRAGLDLVLSKDDRELVLHDYFKGEKRAALASPDGAHLTGDLVNALTGYTQYAQAGGAPDSAKVIGHVTKLIGNATAIRNGVAIVLNQGDNVNKGDVVQSGSDSTLGITFIDGTVFGLGPNAKMVLNEMVYDPNGSSNSALLSLVQGTISFVAGATAKHGDMKVDTPVATMGIRGTAVLVEIDFDVQGTGGVPPAKFQVLVEPDGTTGSYILFDKTTLNPIATVNQAGTQTVVNGQGSVSFVSSANLSPDAQKLISDVFALKFTDNNNPNTKLTTNFTDSVIPISTSFKLASGDTVTQTTLLVFRSTSSDHGSASVRGIDRILGPPTVVTFDTSFTERAGLTHSELPDTTSSQIRWLDLNRGDVPSATASFADYSYRDAGNNDVTSSLTAVQIAAIKAVEAPLLVVQSPGNTNVGSATWTYSVADGAFDFLAAGETLVLTYTARVDNNYELFNETGFRDFTITITGTNDMPVVTSVEQTAAITERPGTMHSAVTDTVNGTLSFTDTDLTDTHTVTITGVAASGVTTGLADQATVLNWLSLGALTDSTDGVTGSRDWTFAAADRNFDYLAAGETLTLTYTIEIDDQHGGVVTLPVTITITGTNDTPVITSAPQVAAITELAGVTGSQQSDVASGTVSFTDLDLSDTHSVAIVSVTGSGVTTGLADQATVLGWLSLGALTDSTGGVMGSRAWTFSAADQNFDYLAVGEKLTLTYSIQVDDHHGGVVTEPVTITITITGTNDKPVITSAPQTGAITEISGTTGSVQPDTASGVVTFADVDRSDTHSVTITGVTEQGVTTGLADHTTVLSWLSLGALTDSTGGVTGSRAWTFSAADHYFDYLAQGETLTLTYSIQVDDHHGAVATQPVTITITGTNDTPVITSLPQAGAIKEAAEITDSPNPDTATGTVSFVDADLSDSHSVTIADVTESGAITGLPDHTTLLSWMSLGTLTDATGGTTGSLAWTFSAADKNFDYLADGATLTLTYAIQVDDHHGGVVTAPVTITITGSNDAPALSDVNAGALIDTADNDSFNSLTGTLQGHDVDDGETATLSYAALDDEDQAVHSAVVGLYGSLTVNADGTYTYIPDAAAINALGKGDYTDTFTIETIDVHGAVGTATLTVDVTGTNDTPTLADLTAGKLLDTPAYDVFSDITGQLTGSDRDTGDTAHLTYAALDTSHIAVNTAIAGAYGSLTVNADGTYTYHPDAAAINALPVGAFADTFTVATIDAHGATGTATLTVDITGDNDAPVINTDNVAVTLNDDGTATVSGLKVVDVDAAADETFTVTATPASWESGNSVNPSPVEGDLAHVNATLAANLVYDQNTQPQSTEMITILAADGHDATDTVNLIFNVQQDRPEPVLLTSTSEKDVFFGSDYHDQFVFEPNFNHDTILNFTPGQDQIDLSEVVTTNDVDGWLQQHVAASPTNAADTVITIDAADTITLRGISPSSLTANDFILHPGGGGGIT